MTFLARSVAALALAAGALPSVAGAATGDFVGTHFAGDFCYIATARPTQRAERANRHLAMISIRDNGARVGEGQVGLTVGLVLQSGRSGAVKDAVCDSFPDHLNCVLDGNAGNFTLTPQADDVRLVVGDQGVDLGARRGAMALVPGTGEQSTLVAEKQPDNYCN